MIQLGMQQNMARYVMRNQPWGICDDRGRVTAMMLGMPQNAAYTAA